jgi:SAM-dependent methyltransferase
MTGTAAGPLDSARHWDTPDAVRSYRAFCRKHARYRRANAELIRHAALVPGLAVLDLGAGLGGTAVAALGAMGRQGRVIAVEPARAMRDAGARAADRGIEWHSEIPDGCRPDRILCGAGIWQLTPLAEALAVLRDLLSPGTALCFNIPAVYLSEPDPPGGGRDPRLLELTARLLRGAPPAEAPEGWEPLPDAAGMERMLRDAGFRPVGWKFSLRLTQAACRDWLKLPACSAPLLPGLTSNERAARIDAACAQCDPRSWRWERWRGWTAWVE